MPKRIVLVTLLIIALAGSGAFVNQRLSQTTWKNFEDNSYTFQIKYPPSWHVRKYAEESSVTFSPFEESSYSEKGGSTAYVDITKREESFQQLVEEQQKRVTQVVEKKLFDLEAYKVEETRVSGHKARLFKATSTVSNGKSRIDFVYVIQSSTEQDAYRIVGGFEGESRRRYKNIFEQMISTFALRNGGTG